MKRYHFIWFILITFLTFSTAIDARDYSDTAYIPNEPPLKQHRIETMDRQLGKHQAIKRDFRNQKEFLYLQRRHRSYAQRYLFPRPPQVFKQRGYPYSKRGWELAYRYDRAAFYDRYGYYYGYFNQYGYYFEGEFYRYDRWYRYLDRVRGKGVFGEQYYMPANYRYYGFDPMPYR